MTEVTCTSHRWPWTEGRRTCWEEELLQTLLREEGENGGIKKHHGVDRRILITQEGQG